MTTAVVLVVDGIVGRTKNSRRGSAVLASQSLDDGLRLMAATVFRRQQAKWNVHDTRTTTASELKPVFNELAQRRGQQLISRRDCIRHRPDTTTLGRVYYSCVQLSAQRTL
jgi:hypothetical protein